MRLDLVRLYYANNCSATEALRKFKTQNGLKNNPCDVSAITKLIKKFETTFTLHDLPKSGRPSLNEERKNLISEAIDDTANEFGATSIRRLSSEAGIPKSSTHRIMRNILKLYPFKIQMLQELHPSDKINRLEFCAWLRNNEEKLPMIIWSDEANIHLDGSISRYHCRIWTKDRPTHFLTKSLHSAKVCAWFGFSANFKLKPFFFDSNVNAENYEAMLLDHVRPELARRRKLSSSIFMQDGAPAHFSRQVRQCLLQMFDQTRVISRGCEVAWPPRSPDLNPLDFYFWGTLKARIFHFNYPKTLDELKIRIEEECDRFTQDELSTAICSIWTRLQMLESEDGGHFEHLM